MRFKSLLLSSLLLLGVACQTVAPTPILIGRLTNTNNELAQHYTDCSEGANYVPTKEDCDPELLSTQVDELMALSLDFIKADIKQPHGYDVYLATTMLYFRMGERSLNEYTRAEQLARQFFEVLKAHAGRSIDDARFYLAHFTAARASKQYFEDPLSLTEERKAELLFALEEGTPILNKLEGLRRVRLSVALEQLQFVIDSIQ